MSAFRADSIFPALPAARRRVSASSSFLLPTPIANNCGIFAYPEIRCWLLSFFPLNTFSFNDAPRCFFNSSGSSLSPHPLRSISSATNTSSASSFSFLRGMLLYSIFSSIFNILLRIMIEKPPPIKRSAFKFFSNFKTN